MKKSGKSMRIVYGPVHPVVEKQEIIKIPSEKAGEKRIVTHIDLQNELTEFLELQSNRYTCELVKDGVKDGKFKIRRLTKDGKEIVTDQDKKQTEQDTER
ncbi:MAG: hypothetical protein HFJ34_07480 [Clostridia bacterium]|nr:hypothetical protein [Clostridia bacterium]